MNGIGETNETVKPSTDESGEAPSQFARAVVENIPGMSTGVIEKLPPEERAWLDRELAESADGPSLRELTDDLNRRLEQIGLDLTVSHMALWRYAQREKERRDYYREYSTHAQGLLDGVNIAPVEDTAWKLAWISVCKGLEKADGEGGGEKASSSNRVIRNLCRLVNLRQRGEIIALRRQKDTRAASLEPRTRRCIHYRFDIDGNVLSEQAWRELVDEEVERIMKSHGAKLPDPVVTVDAPAGTPPVPKYEYDEKKVPPADIYGGKITDPDDIPEDAWCHGRPQRFGRRKHPPRWISDGCGNWYDTRNAWKVEDGSPATPPSDDEDDDDDDPEGGGEGGGGTPDTGDPDNNDYYDDSGERSKSAASDAANDAVCNACNGARETEPSDFAGLEGSVTTVTGGKIIMRRDANAAVPFETQRRSSEEAPQGPSRRPGAAPLGNGWPDRPCDRCNGSRPARAGWVGAAVLRRPLSGASSGGIRELSGRTEDLTTQLAYLRDLRIIAV